MVEMFSKKAGHLCIFLPKYHPELNTIRGYWGYMKHPLRLHRNSHMPKILPDALSGIFVDFIRAYSRVSPLCIEAYDVRLVDYLKYRDLKDWKTHRSSTDKGDSVMLARGKGKTDEHT